MGHVNALCHMWMRVCVYMCGGYTYVVMCVHLTRDIHLHSEWVMGHVNESWDMWMSHGTCECVVPHVNACVCLYVWWIHICGDVCVFDARHTYTLWMSHGTCEYVGPHVNESCQVCHNMTHIFSDMTHTCGDVPHICGDTHMWCCATHYHICVSICVVDTHIWWCLCTYVTRDIHIHSEWVMGHVNALCHMWMNRATLLSEEHIMFGGTHLFLKNTFLAEQHITFWRAHTGYNCCGVVSHVHTSHHNQLNPECDLQKVTCSSESNAFFKK